MSIFPLARGAKYLAGEGVPLPVLEAQLLLAVCLGIRRETLLAMSPAPLPKEAEEAFQQVLRRRAGGTPLAYLLGSREFWSLDLAVDTRVLVPRPETELLVESAKELLSPGCRVVDVGTGSGNIAVSIAREIEEGSWFATDISLQALQVAALNVGRHGLKGKVHLLCGDLLEAVRNIGGFDAVLSNPPYIPKAKIAGLQPEISLHEPRIALDGGGDGLEIIRRLIASAPVHLRTGGWLLLEVGDGQSAAVKDLLEDDGRYRHVTAKCDLGGVERVVLAEREPWTA